MKTNEYNNNDKYVKRSGVGNNLDYNNGGKELEEQLFHKYYNIIVEQLNLEGDYSITLDSGSDADKDGGHDLIVYDNGDTYAVSLRCRRFQPPKFSKGFTTSYKYPYYRSDLVKWERGTIHNDLKLKHHIEIRETYNDAAVVRKVVEPQAFVEFAKDALKDSIDEFYVQALDAQEWTDTLTANCVDCIEHDFYFDDDY